MFNKCPICDGELIIILNNCHCKNNCYSRTNSLNKMNETIFGKTFVFDFEEHSERWKEVEKDLNNELIYWKENDRYLAKILGGNDSC